MLSTALGTIPTNAVAGDLGRGDARKRPQAQEQQELERDTVRQVDGVEYPLSGPVFIYRYVDAYSAVKTPTPAKVTLNHAERARWITSTRPKAMPHSPLNRRP